jgi:hypothetical protein
MDESALVKSDKITYTEREFTANGIAWTELKAEGARRRWYCFFHLEAKRNVIMILYQWWLDAPEAADAVAEVTANFRWTTD